MTQSKKTDLTSHSAHVSAAVFSSGSFDHTWKIRRMNPEPPSLVTLDSTMTVSPATLGASIVNGRRPAQWRFAKAPSPERDPRSPQFARFRAGSAVSHDEADVDQWLDAALAHLTRLDQLAPPEILQTEQDHWRKLTVQVGELTYWFAQRQGPVAPAANVPGEYHDLARSIITKLVSYGRSAVPDPVRPDPADTNAGWPTFARHPAGKVVGALLLSQTGEWEPTEQLGRQLASLVGLPPATAFAYGLGGRSGPLRKLADVYRYQSPGHWSVSQQWEGACQRNRVVYMGWAGGNQATRPLYQLLATARRVTPGLWHGNQTAGGELRRVTEFPYQYEADISAHDVSVLPALQDCWQDALLRAAPELRREIVFWRRVEDLFLITPSWAYIDGEFTAAHYKGGEKSGQKLTSHAATLSGLLSSLYALQQQGFDVGAWPATRDFAICDLGDDVRFGCSRPVDPDAFAAAFATLGFKAVVRPGLTFLSRYTGAGFHQCPIAGRIIQQTMSN